MVGQVTHVFSATQAELSSNTTFATVVGQATTWVGPNEWNSAHAVAVTLSGNTSNASTVSGTNIILAGGNNITLSGTSNTISIIDAIGDGITQSSSWLGGVTATVATAGNLGTLSLGPFFVEDNLAFNIIKMPFSAGTASTSTTTASSTAGSTISFGIYSQGTGAGSTTLTLMMSTSLTLAQAYSSNSLSLSYPVSTSQVTSLVTGSLSTTNMSLVSGQFNFIFPFQTTLTSGQYWMGLLSSSAGGTGATKGIHLSQIVEPRGGYLDGKAPNISVSGGQMSVSTSSLPATIATSALVATAPQAAMFALAHNFGS